MATKNEKALAEQLYTLVSEISGKVDSDGNEIVSSDICESILAVCDGIMSEADDSMLRSSVGNAFTYEGISEYHSKGDTPVPEDERPDRCRFAVYQGHKLVIEFWYDKSLKWILEPLSDGKFRKATMKPLPASSKSIRPALKKIAEEELKHPGLWAEKYYRGEDEYV